MGTMFAARQRDGSPTTTGSEARIVRHASRVIGWTLTAGLPCPSTVEPAKTSRTAAICAPSRPSPVLMAAKSSSRCAVSVSGET